MSKRQGCKIDTKLAKELDDEIWKSRKKETELIKKENKIIKERKKLWDKRLLLEEKRFCAKYGKKREY